MRLGMSKIDIVQMVEMILKLYNNNEIPKKDLQKEFNKQQGINL